MKLQKIKYSLFAVAGLVVTSFTSCDKYLDAVPDQRTELNTAAKVGELLVSAYPSGNYIPYAEAMSDNVTDNFGLTDDGINTDAYFWRDSRSTSQDSPNYYWNNAYGAIAAANQAIEACESASDPRRYDSYRGEALVARAYAHFMLVSLYAKMYDPATADTDPGVPYVTEPEDVVFKEYDRKTVAYVYEQIEKDLLEGLPLLDDSRYKVPRYHFTRRAAHAFAVRFYLFKQEPEKVIEHANKAFPNETFANNLRPWAGKYQEITAAQLELDFTKASENANLLIAQTTSWWGRRYKGNRYSLSSNLRDRIVHQTVAGSLNLYRWTIRSSMSYFIRKYNEHFVRTSLSATTGRGYLMVPLLTTEEVLLSRAEAYVRLDQYDEALEDLNLFLRNRQTAASHTPLTLEQALTYFETQDAEEALIQSVLQMRRAEFVHEGLRWFDILRYKIPVVHTTYDGTVMRLEPDDPRRQWQLPEEVVLSGVEMNPR